MQVAQIIAGYTLGQADILRRIMGKKKVEKLAEEKVKFMAGAEKLGRDPQHAKEIFEMLEPFAQYGFNKSHAVAYSIVAYQTAFLKANYPSEFLAANLTNEMGNPEKFKEYLALADTMGIKLMPPDINNSDKHFNVVDGNIVYGLSGIKNVGDALTALIVGEREKNGPYKNFSDFLSRQADLNSRAIEALIKAGTFDSLGYNRATLIANLEDAIAYEKSSRETTAYGQISLFGDDVSLGSYEMKVVDEWPKRELLEMEKEYLGFYVSGHPLDNFKEDIERCVWVDISKPQELPVNRNVSLICQVTGIKPIKTKTGSKMAAYTLVNYQGTFEAVAFPKDYEKLEDSITIDGIYGFVGYFDNRKDPTNPQFVVKEVCQPSELKTEAISSLIVEINEEAAVSDSFDMLVNDLKSYLVDHGGPLPVYAYLGENRKEKVRFGREYAVAYSKELKREIAGYPLINSAWFE